MGVLGIMAGVFLAFPFFSIPIVQAFWLLAAGVLFLGRFPNGTPPAWETGRAEPWPTRQEMLEQGKAKQGAKGGAPAKASVPPPVDPVDSALGRPEHSRSKKKKRRR
jgi:hypothetical protein